VQLLLWLLQRYMLTRIVVPAHVDWKSCHKITKTDACQCKPSMWAYELARNSILVSSRILLIHSYSFCKELRCFFFDFRSYKNIHHCRCYVALLFSFFFYLLSRWNYQMQHFLQVWVIVDRVWIEYWIYWSLTHTTFEYSYK
jgi:hypothetical protein